MEKAMAHRRCFLAAILRRGTGGGVRNLRRRAFGWGGAVSTFFWVDRQEQLVGLFLTQLVPSAAYPLRAEMMALTYQAVIG